MRSIYHTVPCAIIRVLRTKCGYKLLTFNQALGKILGRDEEELAQLDWSEGCCPQIVQEDLKKLQEALEKLKKPGDRADVMYRIRDTAGGVLHIQSSNLFINGNEKGQVIQRFAYDITERVRMEADLERKSYEDSMTGMFNRSRFNLEMERGAFERCEHLGVACLDINGLKAVNDRDGHRAGDDLIRRTANHIRRIFDGKAYRTGGDEFLILDDEREKPDFLADIDRVRTDMKEDGISISVGISWRRSPCSFQEQFDEADKRMYDEKKKFYSIQEHDRRKRGGKPSHLPASRNILR